MKPAILFIEFIQCQLHPYNSVVVVVIVIVVITMADEVDEFRIIKKFYVL
jgi:hypothetical protein